MLRPSRDRKEAVWSGTEDDYYQVPHPASSNTSARRNTFSGSRQPLPHGRGSVGLSLALIVGFAGCATPPGALFASVGPSMVWPKGFETPRIKYLGLIRDSGDLRAGQTGGEVFAAALRGPRPAIKFSGPHALAIGATNLVAVADSAGGAVHIIDLETREHIITTGWGDERFGSPVGVTWVGRRLFVTDAQRHEVLELNVAGGVVRAFGKAELKRPVGVAYVPARERLYVVDGAAHAIKMFGVEGGLVGQFGGPGSEPGRFNLPSHLSPCGGQLVVSDSGNFRVQVLDLDGNVVRVFGKKGDGGGDFALPKGVACDSEGHIYVVDAQFENVQVFDSQGQLLIAFGEEGRGPGQFWLPAGIAVDQQDRVWVTDSGNRRLQVFQYLRAAS